MLPPVGSSITGNQTVGEAINPALHRMTGSPGLSDSISNIMDHISRSIASAIGGKSNQPEEQGTQSGLSGVSTGISTSNPQTAIFTEMLQTLLRIDTTSEKILDVVSDGFESANENLPEEERKRREFNVAQRKNAEEIIKAINKMSGLGQQPEQSRSVLDPIGDEFKNATERGVFGAFGRNIFTETLVSSAETALHEGADFISGKKKDDMSVFPVGGSASGGDMIGVGSSALDKIAENTSVTLDIEKGQATSLESIDEGIHTLLSYIQDRVEGPVVGKQKALPAPDANPLLQAPEPELPKLPSTLEPVASAITLADDVSDDNEADILTDIATTATETNKLLTKYLAGPISTAESDFEAVRGPTTINADPSMYSRVDDEKDKQKPEEKKEEPSFLGTAMDMASSIGDIGKMAGGIGKAAGGIGKAITAYGGMLSGSVTAAPVAVTAASAAAALYGGYQFGSWANEKIDNAEEGTVLHDVKEGRDSFFDSMFSGVDNLTGGWISGDAEIARKNWEESSLGKFFGAGGGNDKKLEAEKDSSKADALDKKIGEKEVAEKNGTAKSAQLNNVNSVTNNNINNQTILPTRQTTRNDDSSANRYFNSSMKV